MQTRNGFTVVEVMLYIALSSGIAFALFGMLDLVELTRMRMDASAEVASQASWAMERMRDVATGTVLVPADGELSDELVMDSGRIVVIDGALVYSASTGDEVLTTSRVRVHQLSALREDAIASQSLVRISFTMVASSAMERAPVSSSYETSFYAF